jgi:hypothetical protein
MEELEMDIKNLINIRMKEAAAKKAKAYEQNDDCPKQHTHITHHYASLEPEFRNLLRGEELADPVLEHYVEILSNICTLCTDPFVVDVLVEGLT